MIRLRTWKYLDGSKHSEQWDELLMGEWPYSNSCNEVIFVMNTKNPIYEYYIDVVKVDKPTFIHEVIGRGTIFVYTNQGYTVGFFEDFIKNEDKYIEVDNVKYTVTGIEVASIGFENTKDIQNFGLIVRKNA